ncbi:AraC-like DNA-binding protein [Pontibacter aydingkolensis]|uniref:AraC family transcriptional regulator n=1 Tax=Pontibacter aydingkolensis TaxID=1911536 RepID=A0ABS7CZN1_9BACT|nr:AraC family transcriptional regulator [Pontibacter aydingkolensis]MBW7469245.1 AraC family transcriptional regulator [Pontibacter aydingkolensis]
MNEVFLESKTNDVFSQLSIEALVAEIFERIKNNHARAIFKKPDWVKKLQEIIIDDTEANFSLTFLSSQLDIHPVHLSRSFHKYFGTTLGAYIRHLKLNKAILLLATEKSSMTEICYKCGFYDQSHFISTFKRVYRVTPSEFLKRIASC